MVSKRRLTETPSQFSFTGWEFPAASAAPAPTVTKEDLTAAVRAMQASTADAIAALGRQQAELIKNFSESATTAMASLATQRAAPASPTTPGVPSISASAVRNRATQQQAAGHVHAWPAQATTNDVSVDVTFGFLMSH